MSAASRISQTELEAYLWGAATLLRGTIDAGEYKSFIFPLLFLKRLSDAERTAVIQLFNARKDKPQHLQWLTGSPPAFAPDKK